MKRKIFGIIGALCAAVLCATAFVACSGPGDDPNGDSTPTTYTITTQNGTGYTLTADKSTAKEGEKVTVTAAVTDYSIYIDSVKYNNSTCSLNSGQYSFIMPAEDVEIKAVTANYKEVTSDSTASLADYMTTVVKNARYPYALGTTAANTYLFTINTGWEIQDSSLKSTVLKSSNTTAIPDEALSYETRTNSNIVGSSGDNRIQQIIVKLDTSQVTVGNSYVTMAFASKGSSKSFELCLKLTIVESGDYEVATMQETLKINISNSVASDSEDFTLRLFDYDFIEGSVSNGTANTSWFDVPVTLENGVLTATFDYAIGHRYMITLTTGSTYSVYDALTLSNTVQGSNGYYATGDSTTAYLVYGTANATVELNVTGWTYPDKH